MKYRKSFLDPSEVEKLVSIKAKCEKVQWKSIKQINDDVYEACDLNVH